MASVDVSQTAPAIYVTQKIFSEQIGVSLHVVRGWVKKGFLPVFDIGKYRLINVELMRSTALKQDFKF